MIIPLILALLIGIIAGTFTGLAPGIHINLIAAILLSSLALFNSVPPIALAVFIVSMSITHTFLDFIPSIYLGAPEEDNFLAVLPGHRMLLEGKGHEAVLITLSGALIALPLVLILAPIFVNFLPIFFSVIKSIIPFILIFASLYLVFREKSFLVSIVVFILAGFLGLAAFNTPVKEPLLPLLTGLFGVSSLIVSLKSKISLPKQHIISLKSLKIFNFEYLKAALSAFIAAPLCSFLPGIGAGHAAVIGSEFFKQSNKSFLFLIGSVNTIVMSLSFVTAYAIGKTRTGSAAAVQSLLQNFTLSDLFIILASIVMTGIIAFALGVSISKLFTSLINKINYSILSFVIIGILLLVNIVFSNWLGILVLITASALGIFCILSNSRRINLMGSLLIPSIIYYLIN